MSTPYTVLASWTRSLAVSFWIIWVSTMILSRIHVFHRAYVSENQKVADEKYLLEKCMDAEFYSNIRQHTSICTEVAENARSSVLLKSLHVMAQTTHLCGESPCSEVIRACISRLTWQVTALIAVFALIFPNALLSLSRSVSCRRKAWVEREIMARHLQQGPFYQKLEGGFEKDIMDQEDYQSMIRRRKPFDNGMEHVRMV